MRPLVSAANSPEEMHHESYMADQHRGGDTVAVVLA
jgi:hypothetical protein